MPFHNRHAVRKAAERHQYRWRGKEFNLISFVATRLESHLMFATICSFCQHENQPGARFCAECGSPLHLKVCQACGKVSDVQSLNCESCGAVFPEIDMVAAAPRVTPGATPNGDPVPAPAPPPRLNPWPLIAVAAVAGGLPFLWIFRNDLPMPKTWQSRAEQPQEVRAPVQPTVTPRPPAEPRVPATPAPVESQPPSAAAPTSASAPAPEPAAKPKPPGRAERAKGETRPCTDAVAALGLCKPTSQTKK